MSFTPIPQKIAKAREEATAFATLTSDVGWIKRALESGHVCHQDAVIKNHEKRLDGWRALTITLGVFILGIAITVAMSCLQNDRALTVTTERAATNKQAIETLQKNLDTMNQTREQETRQVLSAIRSLQPGPLAVPAIKCSQLSLTERRAVRKVLGRDPCEPPDEE